MFVSSQNSSVLGNRRKQLSIHVHKGLFLFVSPPCYARSGGSFLALTSAFGATQESVTMKECEGGLTPLCRQTLLSRALECDNGVCVQNIKRHHHTKQLLLGNPSTPLSTPWVTWRLLSEQEGLSYALSVACNLWIKSGPRVLRAVHLPHAYPSYAVVKWMMLWRKRPVNPTFPVGPSQRWLLLTPKFSPALDTVSFALCQAILYFYSLLTLLMWRQPWTQQVGGTVSKTPLQMPIECPKLLAVCFWLTGYTEVSTAVYSGPIHCFEWV